MSRVIGSITEGAEVRVTLKDDKVVTTIAFVTGGRVDLSQSFRAALADARKAGLTVGQIGNDLLALATPRRVRQAAVAYANAIRNTNRVNQYWGAA